MSSTLSFTEMKEQLLEEISTAESIENLESIRVAILGKSGKLTTLLKSLGKMPPEERRERGQALNSLRVQITDAVTERRGLLEDRALDAQIESGKLDVTLMPTIPPQGSIHPVTQVTEEMIEIFARFGFEVAEGPEIENDWYNFTALNIPPEHPARAMHDSFYVKDHTVDHDMAPMVLRTHTSPVQIRAMQTSKPPIRIIAPGRTYRCDSDATHTPMFHQVEGLVIDKEINMGHLRWILAAFIKAFFGIEQVKTRFRPSYFPFTEPSAEMDIGCSWSEGKLNIGQGNDWLEILGCGMVNPRVLEHAGLDSSSWQGFAFGCGIDRLAMLKYGMTDLRAFFNADLHWLRHHGFSMLDLPNLTHGGTL